MYLSIRDDVYCCTCAEQVIVLDARAERYFMLPERLRSAFLRLWDGVAPEERDPILLRSLISTGIVTSDQVPTGRCAQPVVVTQPRRELAVHTAHRIPWTEVAYAAFHQMSCRLTLRRGQLMVVLADLQGDPRDSPVADDTLHEQISRVAMAFRATSGLIRQQDQCLPRSISFARICKKRGVKVTLVIGVALDPFSAHAWVQEGDAVLNDTIERIRCYTPILAV